MDVIKYWKEIIVGSSRTLREIARAFQDAVRLRNGRTSWRTPVFCSKKQIRVLLFRECDWRGRKLLFDSKTVVKKNTPPSTNCSNCSANSSKESSFHLLGHNQPKNQKCSPDSAFEFLRTSSDEKMLGEMVFGSVAMSYYGTTMKIHTIRSPPQLMISFVFPISRPSSRARDFEVSGSLQNSTSEILIPSYSNKLEASTSPSLAYSVPLDVPSPFDYASYYHENGFNESGSFRSTTSNSSMTTSSLYYSHGGDSQGSSLTRSSSYNSFQRRLLRNINTNIECGLVKRLDELSTCYDEAKLNGRRRVKLGLSVIFTFEENSDEFSNFQEFFFSHIALIEGHVNKVVDTATQPFSNRQSFLKALFDATTLFQSSIQDLYTSIRLSQPLWLSMISPSSNHHHQCRKFMGEFLHLIRQYDTKQTHFFVSTLLTSVLTHHLAWVSTVRPTEGTSTHNFQRKEAADWLDMLAKSHPYNPLWMQLGDLYGAVGFPTKIARTIIQGKQSEVVMNFLNVLSYFVRCSNVYEKIEEGETPSDYLDEAVVLSNSEEHSGITANQSVPIHRGRTNSVSQETVLNSEILPKPCAYYECGALKSNCIKNSALSRQSSEVLFTLGDAPILTGLNKDPISAKINFRDDEKRILNDPTIDGRDSLGYGSLVDISDKLCDNQIAHTNTESCKSTNHITLLKSVPVLKVGCFEELPSDVIVPEIELDYSIQDMSGKHNSLSAQELVNKAKLYIQEYNNLRFMDEKDKAATQTVLLNGHTDIQISGDSTAERTEDKDIPEEGYQSMEDIKSFEAQSLGSMIQSVYSCLPPGTKELDLPRVQLKNVGAADSYSGLGWSLLAGISDHYLSDFCLQGVVGTLSEEKMYDDLTASTETSVLGEPISAAVCIVANTDLWSVKLCTNFASNKGKQKVTATMSPLVAGICDSLLQMSQLNMSSEFCLMHLEDRLQELYFRSQSLACLLQEDSVIDPTVLLNNSVELLNINMHDLPLLISVASTHTPQLSRYELSLKGLNVNTVQEICIALFGLGRIGTIHGENLVKLPGTKLLYCIEEDYERAKQWTKKWNQNNTTILTVKDEDKVFEDPRVDAVVICTPTFMHEGLVLKALKAGKSVFCEKPLAHSYDGIKRCYELSKSQRRPLFCAFNRRFDPTFEYIQKRVKMGDVGDIHMVKTCSRDSPRPAIEYLKTSGGIFHDCGAHDVDLICWIMDALPISVYSSASSFHKEIKDIKDHDTVAITLTFPSGALGIIDLSRSACYGYDQRLEVFGSKGMLTSTEMRPISTQFSSATSTQSVPILHSFASRYQHAYVLEMEHFMREVKGSDESIISGSNVLATSKICTACEESAQNGKAINLYW